MELHNHDEIIQAINDRNEVRVEFPSKEDGGAILSRVCAPMDFGPGRRVNDQTPRYHFWDLESDSGVNHTLSLMATQITSVEVLRSSFDPSSFVSWDPKWIVARTTWGEFN
jgi:hypothetical protein